MHVRGISRWLAVVSVGTVIAGGATAQSVALKARGSSRSGTSTVTVTTGDSGALVTIKSANADARSVFRDVSAKSGVKILLGSTAGGFVTSTVENQPLETAIKAVAATAGLSVRKITTTKETAAVLTADTASALAGALSDISANATVIDPATGRAVTITFASTAPKADAGQVSVYYVLKVPRAGRTTAATGDAVKDAEANAAAILGDLSTSDRLQAMQDMMRQTFEGMTDTERQQLRQQGGPGGPGGPGESGGGPGGPPDGFGGGPGGPPPDAGGGS